MPQLPEIQLHIRQAVIAGDDGGIVPLLVGGRNPGRRLEVHRRHYETSLATALHDKFPATVWLLGSPFILEAARQYVREHPPLRPCIAEYGAEFPQFLSTRPAAERVPYLPEFAELEWHIGHASIAVDAAALRRDVLAGIPAEALPDAVLTLQKGLRYLYSSWPIDSLLELYLTEHAPDSLEFEPEEVWIEVGGARGEFRLNRLTRSEFVFRESILEAGSIGDAAEAALDVEAGFDPGRSLVALFTGGLVTGVRSYFQEER